MRLSPRIIQRALECTVLRCSKSFLSTKSTTATATMTKRSFTVTKSLHGSSFPDCSMISSNHRHFHHQYCHSYSSKSTNKQDDEMKDEYGVMDDSGDSYRVDHYVLENGSVLPQATLRYQTYGSLNDNKTNVLLICHALTGNASLHSWWDQLLGEGLAFDTSKYFVVCCNILGSCYGSTGPRSIDPTTGKEYGITFPDVSVKDTVRLQLKLLQEHLGIQSVKSVIGGSFGGMQSIEAAVQGGSSVAEFFTMDNGK
jgi:homoserine acetyltransferase